MRPLVPAALAFALFAPPAIAEEPETEGERLFRQGRAAMLEDRFEEACPMLAESQRLEPHVGTLLNLAACDERRGHYGSAWVEYQKALTAARAEGQTDRAKLAEARIAAIEPRVPWLRVSAPRGAASDLAVSLDGGDLAQAAWGTEMPVDPGPHVVVATREGKRVFEGRVEIREGEHRTIAITIPTEKSEGQRPEHVVVEPKQPSTDATATKPLGRWILEAGVFVGFMTGSTSNTRPVTSSGLRGVELSSISSPPQDSDCGSRRCEVGEVRHNGAVFGLSFFGGYALNDSVGVGLRVLGAPNVTGGGFFAFGPSLVLRATSALSIGAFAAFGDASFSGYTGAVAPSGYRVKGGSAVVAGEGTLAGAAVFGLDVALEITELKRGSLLATAMPVFLSNIGSAFALPLGIAYRFQ